MSPNCFLAGRRALLRATTASAALAVAFTISTPVSADNETHSIPHAPEVLVEASAEPEPAQQVVTPDMINASPARDAGEFLARLRGVSAGRMGGHGSEISIRGQSEDRIAVIGDGAYVFGACPNRMDPPSSAMLLMSGDRITVRRGYQSVLDGPPAPAGTIRMERADPADMAAGFSGRIESGIESNGAQRFATMQARGVAEDGYVRAFATARRAGNYKDGDGRDVRSAFEQYGGGLETGWRYGAGSVLSASVETDRVEDTLFAGAGMDSPWTATDTYRLALDHNIDGQGALRRIKANVYGSFVDHVMDNYSLRTPSAMVMRTDAESNTMGGRFAGEFSFSAAMLTLGVDHRSNNRDAVSRMSMGVIPPTSISGYTWPDVEIRDTGIFAESETSLTERTALTAGARVDLVAVSAGKADLLPAGMGALTARQLYAAYYGVSDTDRNETNLSGLLRVTHDFGSFAGWLGVSRAVRTADATERGIARASGANSWVGNPGLQPEKHHQIDLGIEMRRTRWSASTGVWHDNVSDFISRDTARGQPGVLMANGASIFRNVDAELTGLDLEGVWNFAPGWRLGGDATYTYGRNVTDDRPLYQIPPLEGTFEFAYEVPDWSAGIRTRWAVKQTHADTNPLAGSGLDVRETPGYAVVDLFASRKVFGSVEFRGGVANLLDATYASHLSRSNGFDPAVVQVNEPGRSFYIQASLDF